MPIINSYPTITPTSSDLLLISDVSVEGNPTKTATVNSILALAPGGGSGGGTITSIESTNTNYLSVTNPSGPIVTLGLNVGQVIQGGDNLATTGDIYTFTTTEINNAITNLGTIGTVTQFSCISTALAAIDTSVTNANTTPQLTLTPFGGNPGEYLDYEGNWSTPGGTGAMSSFNVAGDNSAMNFTISDGQTVNVLGGTYIDTAADPIAGDELTIQHASTTTATPTGTPLAPGEGGTFNVIDAISVDSDGKGHVTSIQTTQITLPAAGGGGGTGTVTEVGLNVSAVAFLSSTPAFITTNGSFAVTATGDVDEYVKGDGSLGDIADIPGTYTFSLGDASNQNAIVSGTPIKFVAAANSGISTSWNNTTKELTIDSSNTGTVTKVEGSGVGSFITVTTTPSSGIISQGTLTAVLNASGSPSSNTFLRGDNQWAEVTVNTSDVIQAGIGLEIDSTTTPDTIQVDYASSTNNVVAAAALAADDTIWDQSSFMILEKSGSGVFKSTLKDFFSNWISDNITGIAQCYFSCNNTGLINKGNTGNTISSQNGFQNIAVNYQSTGVYKVTFDSVGNTDYMVNLFAEIGGSSFSIKEAHVFVINKGVGSFTIVAYQSSNLTNLLVNVTLYKYHS